MTILPYDQNVWFAKKINNQERTTSQTSHLFTGNIYNCVIGEYSIEELKDDFKRSISTDLETDGLSSESTRELISFIIVIKNSAERKEYYELCGILDEIIKEINYV